LAIGFFTSELAPSPDRRIRCGRAESKSRWVVSRRHSFAKSRRSQATRSRPGFQERDATARPVARPSESLGNRKRSVCDQVRLKADTTTAFPRGPRPEPRESYRPHVVCIFCSSVDFKLSEPSKMPCGSLAYGNISAKIASAL